MPAPRSSIPPRGPSQLLPPILRSFGRPVARRVPSPCPVAPAPESAVDCACPDPVGSVFVNVATDPAQLPSVGRSRAVGAIPCRLPCRHPKQFGNQVWAVRCFLFFGTIPRKGGGAVVVRLCVPAAPHVNFCLDVCSIDVYNNGNLYTQQAQSPRQPRARTQREHANKRAFLLKPQTISYAKARSRVARLSQKNTLRSRCGALNPPRWRRRRWTALRHCRRRRRWQAGQCPHWPCQLWRRRLPPRRPC